MLVKEPDAVLLFCPLYKKTIQDSHRTSKIFKKYRAIHTHDDESVKHDVYTFRCL